MSESTYIVWRREDGYVAASNVSTLPDRKMGTGFTELLRTHNWTEAHDLIAKERDTDKHRALMTEWAHKGY